MMNEITKTEIEIIKIVMITMHVGCPVTLFGATENVTTAWSL